MKKLLLFDVDGTLINYDGYLPQSTVLGIRLARRNGHYAFIVTGRSRAHIEKEILDIGFDGFICGNGAYIEVHDKIIKERTLNDNDVRCIVDYLENHHLEFFIESNDGLYGSKNFETRGVEALRRYGIKDPVIREIYPDMTFPKSLYQSKVTKINFILESYQDFLDFQKKFSGFKVTTWGGQGETAIFGDIALDHIDKSDAIIELAEYLNIQKDDMVAFGDAEVDIPMFQCVKDSICLGGGRIAAKKAATYVTDSVDNDGIYNALKYFHII